MAYSLDLRKKVCAYVASGYSKMEASKVFSLSRTTVTDWVKREENGRGLAIKPIPGRPRKLDYEAMAHYITSEPDAYLVEIGDHFGVSDFCIYYACKKLNISRKKNDSI